MKKLVKVLALVLSVVMLATSFTACGSEVAVSDYGKTVAATYGDEEIMMDEVAFFLRYQQMNMESYYWSYYTALYGYSTLWEAPYDEYKTLGVYIKELAMKQAYQTRILIDHASEYNLSEADIDEEACKEAAQDMYDSLDEAFFEYSDVTVEKLTEWLKKNDLAYQVYEAIKEAAEVEVTAEETEMYTVKYVSFTADTTEEDEDAGEEETTEAALTAEEKAQNFYDAIKAGGDIDTVAKEENYTVSSASYLISTAEEDMTADLQKNTYKLAKDESAVFGSESGTYYVAVRTSDVDEDATASKVESVTDSKKEEKFNELYATWQDSAKSLKVTDAWENLVVCDGEKLIPDTTAAEEEETEATTVAEETTTATEETTEEATTAA